MDSLSLKSGSALVVIAHPDDETVWMGGTILKFKNVKWTIFCLCRAKDPDRAPKFRRACKQLGVRAIISDLEDEEIMSIKKSVPEIKKRIKRVTKGKRYNYIFTHNKNGEYGHPRHKGVHQAIKKLIEEGTLSANKTYFFRYLPTETRAVPDKKACFVTRLSLTLHTKKKNLVNKIYGFNKNSFEYRSASNAETFNKLKI